LGNAKYGSLRVMTGIHHKIRSDILPLIHINESELEVVFELTEDILNSPKKDALLTFLGCWSERDDHVNETAFILSWICIEICIFSQLEASNVLDAIYEWKKDGSVITIKKGPKKGMKKELTAGMAIERLRDFINDGDITFDNSDPTAITGTLLDDFDKIRDVRNTIVHGDRVATEEEMKECFILASKAMFRLMRLGRIDYSSHLKKIGPLKQNPVLPPL